MTGILNVGTDRRALTRYPSPAPPALCIKRPVKLFKNAEDMKKKRGLCSSRTNRASQLPWAFHCLRKSDRPRRDTGWLRASDFSGLRRAAQLHSPRAGPALSEPFMPLSAVHYRCRWPARRRLECRSLLAGRCPARSAIVAHRSARVRDINNKESPRRHPG